MSERRENEIISPNPTQPGRKASDIIAIQQFAASYSEAMCRMAEAVQTYAPMGLSHH